MRKMIFGLAVAGALALSASAQATMILNVTKAVSGGYNVYNLYAFNDGVGTGTKLQGYDITVSTPGTFKMDIRDWEGTDGENDVNFTGTATTGGSSPYNLTPTTTVGSYFRFAAPSNLPVFMAVNGIASPNYRTDPNETYEKTQEISSAWAALQNWRVTMAASGNAQAATSGSGYLFGHLVIPTSAVGVLVQGSLAGEVGDFASVAWTDLPEPASMTMLALGGLLLFRRR